MNGNNSGQTLGNQETLENYVADNSALENELSVSTNHKFDNFTKSLNKDKQGKHIPSHKNYKPGKSFLTISMNEVQSFVNTYSGKGNPIGNNKERVDFGKVIGKYIDPDTGKSYDTTIGIIHYSKTGTHIVPARPKEN